MEAAPGEDYAFVVDGIEFPDPATPLAAARPARALAAARHGRLRLDRRRLRAAVAARGGHLRAARRHVHRARARSTPRSRTCAGCASSGVTTIELMPVAAFPGRHGWGYDGVYISAAHDPYGGPQGLQRFVDAAHARGPGGAARRRLQPRRRLRHAGPGGFGPYFTSHYETPWGRAMNYDDADSDAVREWVLQSAEQWIRDFHLDGLRLDAIHSILDSNPEHLVAAINRRVHAGEPARDRDRRVGHQRPEGAHAVGLRRRLGRRLPPRAARAADRRPRGLLRGVRHARRAGEGAAPPALPRRHLLDASAAAASARPRRRSRPRRSWSSPPTTTRSATARSATGCRSRSRPLAAFMTLLAPFTPMLFQGEEHGERGAVPVLLGPHRRGDRRRDPRGPPARVRRLRRVRRRGGPRPPGRGDLPRLQAHARGRAGGPARPLRRAAARARRAAARRRRARSTSTSTRAGCASRRGPYTVLANFSQRDVHVPVEGTARDRADHASRHPRAGLRRPASPVRSAAEVTEIWPGRPFPLGPTWDGERHQLLPVLRERRARRAVPVRRRGQRDAGRADASAPRTTGTATCPASAPGSATATASTAPTTRRKGHRFNPHKLLIDPYAKSIEGKVRWNRAQRAPVRPDRRAPATTPTSRWTTRTPRSRSPSRSSSTRTSTGRTTARRTRRCTRWSSTRRTSRASRSATRRCARTCAAPTPAWPTRRRSSTSRSSA